MGSARWSALWPATRHQLPLNRAAIPATGSETPREILNDVLINQVLVSFGDAELTRRVIAGVQADGTCWAGGTVWQGRTAMRISVSSWATTENDLERSLAAMVRVASEVQAAAP